LRDTRDGNMLPPCYGVVVGCVHSVVRGTATTGTERDRSADPLAGRERHACKRRAPHAKMGIGWDLVRALAATPGAMEMSTGPTGAMQAGQ
jgi:hypothetical protein